MRKQIGGYREDDASCRRDNDVIAPSRLCRKQDCYDVEDRDGAFQRRKDVDEKNREGENGGAEPPTGTAHG